MAIWNPIKNIGTSTPISSFQKAYKNLPKGAIPSGPNQNVSVFVPGSSPVTKSVSRGGGKTRETYAVEGVSKPGMSPLEAVKAKASGVEVVAPEFENTPQGIIARSNYSSELVKIVSGLKEQTGQDVLNRIVQEKASSATKLVESTNKAVETFNIKSAELEKEASQLESESSKVNVYDEAAVNAFNNKVKRYTEKVNVLKEEASQINAQTVQAKVAVESLSRTQKLQLGDRENVSLSVGRSIKPKFLSVRDVEQARVNPLLSQVESISVRGYAPARLEAYDEKVALAFGEKKVREKNFIEQSLELAPMYGQELAAGGRMQIQGITGVDIEKFRKGEQGAFGLPNPLMTVGGVGRSVVAGSQYSGQVIDLAKETYAPEPKLIGPGYQGPLVLGLSVLKGGQQALGFAGQLAYKPVETVGAMGEGLGEAIFYEGIGRTAVKGGRAFLEKPLEVGGELYGMSILSPLGKTVSSPFTKSLKAWLNEPRFVGTPKMYSKQVNILAEQGKTFGVTGKGKLVYTETTRLNDFLYNLGEKYKTGEGRGFWTKKPSIKQINLEYGFDVTQKKSIPKSLLKIEAIGTPPNLGYELELAKDLGWKANQKLPKILKQKPFSMGGKLSEEAIAELGAKQLGISAELRGSQKFSGQGYLRVVSKEGKVLDTRLLGFEETVYGKKAPKVGVKPTKLGLFPGESIPTRVRLSTRIKSFGETKTKGKVSGEFYDEMGTFKQIFSESGVDVQVKGVSFKGKPKSVFDTEKVKAFAKSKPFDLEKTISTKKVSGFKFTKPIKSTETLRGLQEIYSLESFAQKQGLRPGYESLIKTKPKIKPDLTGYIDLSPGIKVTDTLRKIQTIYKAEGYTIRGKKVPVYVQRMLEPKPNAKGVVPFKAREPIIVDKTLRDLQKIYSGKDYDVFKVKPREVPKNMPDLTPTVKVDKTLKDFAKMYARDNKIAELKALGKPIPKELEAPIVKRALPEPKFVLKEPIKVDKTLRDFKKIYSEELKVEAEKKAQQLKLEKGLERLQEQQISGTKILTSKAVAQQAKYVQSVYGSTIVLKPSRLSKLKYGSGLVYDYEPVESFKGFVQERTFNAQSFKINQAELPRLKEVQAFKQRQVDLTKFKQLQVDALKQFSGESAKQTEAIGIKQAQVQQVKQAQIQQVKQKQLLQQKLFSFVSPRVPVTKIIKIPKSILKIKPKYEDFVGSGFGKPSKAFDVYARVKGREVKIGERLPYGKAFNIGASYVSTRTSKSFYLKPSGFTSIQDIQATNVSKFRRKKGKSKLKENVFIEKNAFAIDTIGEKLGLKKAKKQKRGRFF